MNSLSPNRATTLTDAYRACYLHPLKDEDIEKYYVDLSEVRSSEDMKSISFKFQCLKQGEFINPPILFTGHRGCGKSTELKRIQKQLQSDYLVSYLDANQELDVGDLHYTELYLLIIKELEYVLRRSGLRFNNKLLENFEGWFKEITQETEDSVESSIGTEGQVKVGSEAVPFIAKLMVKLLAQIKGSHKRKKTIRETLEKSIAKLMEDTNLLLKDGFDKIRRSSKFKECKGFLIIIDNLDRLSVPTAKKLFFDYASQLQGLACNIIYTVPISVLYYPEDWFGFFNDSLHTVPMVNIYNFEWKKWHLNYNQQGLEAMISLIEYRVKVENVFDSGEQLLDLAKASGGHVRQIMQLMQEACMIASTRGHKKIMAEDVTYAVERLQLRFQPLIDPDHYSLLAKLCLKKDIKAVADKYAQVMLFNTSVLEYLSNNIRWHYVNPIVKGIHAFQEAIQYTEEEARIISQ